MKRLALILCLLAMPAFAQQRDPTEVALGAEVMECVGSKVQLRTQIARLEAEITKLKAQPEEKKP